MISRRKFIRWLPDPASEPTTTIVLTSPQDRFVDLRIVSPTSLDWAIAGTASSTTVNGIRHSTWSHWIDSKIVDPEGVSDEGDMFPHEEGTLEKGRMVNPATGKDADYEELWDDADAEGPCLVLKLEKGGVRGMCIKLGGLMQSLVRDGEQVTLERWEDGKKTVRMGERELPGWDVGGSVGEVFTVGGDEWEVVEY